jgi:hypothetical protein
VLTTASYRFPENGTGSQNRCIEDICRACDRVTRLWAINLVAGFSALQTAPILRAASSPMDEVVTKPSAFPTAMAPRWTTRRHTEADVRATSSRAQGTERYRGCARLQRAPAVPTAHISATATNEPPVSVAAATRIHPGPLTRSGTASAADVPARNNSDV